MGETLELELDYERINSLLNRVRGLLSLHGAWYTLGEIKTQCGGSEAGISARLRELRNRHGAIIEKRRRGEPSNGLWEYRMVLEINREPTQPNPCNN